MAPRHRTRRMIRTLTALAAGVVVLAVAVMLLAPAPADRRRVAATAAAETASEPVRALPSYVVRIPPPRPPEAAAPPPVTVSIAPLPVAAEAEAADEQPAAEKWYVTARALNIRSGATSQSAPVGALPRGTAVSVTATQGNWMEVTAGDVSGWAYAQYLSQTPP